MSTIGAHRVVEWSPNEAVGFDPATKEFVPTKNLAELATVYGGGPILAAVSRRSTFVKAIRVPNAGIGEIDMILQTQMTAMFPVPLHELAYSFQLTNDITPEGRLAIVAAMREVELQNLQSSAKDAGFKLVGVIPAALGSMILADTMGHKDAAVVQQTREGLAIDLLAGGEVRYSRVAPMPANKALIESEITRSFQAVGLPCAPTIAAGGFPYPEAEFSTTATTLETLATRSMDKLGINLETREVREKRGKARHNNRTRLAVLMCASAALLALLVAVEWSDEAEKVRVGNQRWANTLRKTRDKLKKEETEVGKLAATNDTLKRAFSPAQTPNDVLTVISNHAPKDVWLTGLNMERGKIMYVRGTASTNAAVYTFLQALTAESRLRDVKLVFANNGEIEKTPVVQFSIQAFPVGNLPLVDPKKKGAKK